MDERLRLAYATAMKQRQGSGRVELHLGSEVVEYLRSLCKKVDGWEPPQGAPLAWGFPVIIREDARPDHISVHTVEVIL